MIIETSNRTRINRKVSVYFKFMPFVMLIAFMVTGMSAVHQGYAQDGPTGQDIHGVSFPDEQHGWAVGAEGTVVNSEDGGDSWSLQEVEVEADLKDVMFMDHQTGWAAGNEGSILFTDDGGDNWQVLDSNTEENLLSVKFVDEQHGWSAGENGTVLHTSDGGQTWEEQESGVNGNVQDLAFVDEETGWAVGGTTGFIPTGFILQTEDGGETWSEAEDLMLEPVTAITLLDEHNIRALVSIENEDKIIYSEDAGETWEEEPIYNVPHGSDLLNLAFSDSENGLVVGEDGTVLYTDEGGIDNTAWWEPVEPITDEHLRDVAAVSEVTSIAVGDNGTIVDAAEDAHLADIDFADNQHGWTAGARGTIKHTSDGGMSWNEQQSGTDSTLTSIKAVTTDLVWAAGDAGKILHSSDSGATWEMQETPTEHNLNAIYFVDNKTGWAVGEEGTVLYTNDSGENWENRDDVTATNLTLYDASFTDEDTGWLSGEDATIYHTADGGDSWEVQDGDLDSSILAIEFLDHDTGLGIGAFGFFTMTTNGGEDWQEHDETPDSWMTDLAFHNQQTGWAVGLNGTIMYSGNGGMNWHSSEEDLTDERLNAVAFAEEEKVFAVGDRGVIVQTGEPVSATIMAETPAEYSLEPNYPNPFNPMTVIQYHLPEQTSVQLTVYDILGREVVTLVDEHQQSGHHEVTFDATGLPSGTYLYRIRTEGFNKTRSMMFIK